MIFEGNKMHKDEIIFKTQKFIEQEYKEKITIEKLAEISNLSKRTFQRRFKQATHYKVAEYIQKVRIEAAKNI